MYITCVRWLVIIRASRLYKQNVVGLIHLKAAVRVAAFNLFSMDESACPTPYNSLYIPVKRGEVVCCQHGTACEIGKKDKQRDANGDDNLSEQYVNLVDTKRDHSKKTRDELIQSLAGRLRELDVLDNVPKERRRSKIKSAPKEVYSDEDSSKKQKSESPRRKRKHERRRRDDDEESPRKAQEEMAEDSERERSKRAKRKVRRGRGVETDQERARIIQAAFNKAAMQRQRPDRPKSAPDSPQSSSKDRRYDRLSKDAVKDASGKSTKRTQLESELSASARRGLVDDLDTSDKSKKKKRKREKRKKEKRDIRESSDDSRMLESIRNIMPAEGSQRVEPKKEKEWSRTDSERAPQATPQQLSGLAKSVYIGVCNFAKAEEKVTKKSDFRVYHQLAHHPLLDDLEQELPLIVVYRTANGSFRHYPIRRRKVGNSSYYYVDYGDPKVQAHASLDHLVRYYQMINLWKLGFTQMINLWKKIEGLAVKMGRPGMGKDAETMLHYRDDTQSSPDFLINAQRHPENNEYADQFPWWEVHL